MKLKTHKVKNSFTKDLFQKLSNQLNQVNHRNNPFIAHDSYFLRIMTVPISKSNPKIQCQYVLLKAETFFFIIKTNQKQNLEKEKQK